MRAHSTGRRPSGPQQRRLLHILGAGLSLRSPLPACCFGARAGLRALAALAAPHAQHRVGSQPAGSQRECCRTEECSGAERAVQQAACKAAQPSACSRIQRCKCSSAVRPCQGLFAMPAGAIWQHCLAGDPLGQRRVHAWSNPWAIPPPIQRRLALLHNGAALPPMHSPTPVYSPEKMDCTVPRRWGGATRFTCTVPADQARAKVRPCSSSTGSTNQGLGIRGSACGGGVGRRKVGEKLGMGLSSAACGDSQLGLAQGRWCCSGRTGWLHAHALMQQC